MANKKKLGTEDMRLRCISSSDVGRAAGVTSPLGAVTLLAILISAVALYYYLLILKQAWVVKPGPEARRIRVGFDVAAPLLVTTGLVIALGLAPSAILRLF